MLSTMLEVAKAQGNIEAVADALAINLDSHRLTASTEVINDHAFKVAIENATADEVVALINNLIDSANTNIDISAFEGACGDCAVVVFDDLDMTEAASLEQAGVIFDLSAKPVEDDDEDEPHIVEEDDDVEGDEDDEDEDEKDDPNVMKVLLSEEAFKLATRLQSMACGNNKAEFPHFMTRLDALLTEFRGRSGYNPSESNEMASVEEFAALLIEESEFDPDEITEALTKNGYTVEQASSVVAGMSVEEARKKKKKGKGFREGRGGFLSAYMRFVGKRGDDLADAWDALDIPALTSILSDVGASLMDMVQEERLKRGLDEEPREENPIEDENVEEAAAKKYHVLLSRPSLTGKWEVEFADYDKEVVKEELDSLTNKHKKINLKIIIINSDRQADINDAVNKLNAEVATVVAE